MSRSAIWPARRLRRRPHRRTARRQPHAHALVLSASLDPANVTRAPSSGAAGTPHETADLDQLVDAVRRLHRGAAQPSWWIRP
jgi:DNA-binding NarL/FixJ family response regulator